MGQESAVLCAMATFAWLRVGVITLWWCAPIRSSIPGAVMTVITLLLVPLSQVAPLRGALR